MSEDIKKLAIEAVLNNWFTTVYNKKLGKTKIKINNSYFGNQCGSTYSNLRKKAVYSDGFENFKADYASLCYDIMKSFNPAKHKSNWQEILDLANNNNKQDEHTILNTFSSYVTTSMQYKLIDEFRSDFVSYGRDKKKLYLKIDSINRKYDDSDDDTEISRVVENSSNIFNNQKDKIYTSQINNWFQTDKEKILMKSQIEKLKLWESLDIYDYSEDKLKKHFGTDRSSVRKILIGIGKRTLKNFNKANLKNLTQQQIAADKELKIIEPLIEASKSEAANRIDEMYTILFEIFPLIQMNLKLDASEHISLNKRVKDVELLEKVMNQIEVRYEKLQDILANIEVFEQQEELVSNVSIRPDWTAGIFDAAKEGDSKNAYIIGSDGFAVVKKEYNNRFSEVRTYSLDELENQKRSIIIDERKSNKRDIKSMV